VLENVEGGRRRASWEMRIDVKRRRTRYNVLKHAIMIKVNKAYGKKLKK